jgi:hypothetical protein
METAEAQKEKLCMRRTEDRDRRCFEKGVGKSHGSEEDRGVWVVMVGLGGSEVRRRAGEVLQWTAD